jgi:hypothetical protein
MKTDLRCPMKAMLTKIALLTGCLTLSACVFSDSPEKAGALTKEDAKKITNPGEDLCDVYNWYGDGQCDTFCENADPDCGGCTELASCNDGYYQVDQCSPNAECIEQPTCGQNILCEPIAVCAAASGGV